MTQELDPLGVFDEYVYGFTRNQLEREREMIEQCLDDQNDHPKPEQLAEMVQKYNNLADLSLDPGRELHFQLLYDNEGVPRVVGVYYPDDDGVLE